MYITRILFSMLAETRKIETPYFTKFKNLHQRCIQSTFQLMFLWSTRVTSDGNVQWHTSVLPMVYNSNRTMLGNADRAICSSPCGRLAHTHSELTPFHCASSMQIPYHVRWLGFAITVKVTTVTQNLKQNYLTMHVFRTYFHCPSGWATKFSSTKLFTGLTTCCSIAVNPCIQKNINVFGNRNILWF